MQKEFSLSNGKAMINFTAKYCNTANKLLNSHGFKTVLRTYLLKIKKRESNIYKYIEQSINGEDTEEKIKGIIELFKLLMVLSVEEIEELNLKYDKLLEDKDKFSSFIEDLYSFWRNLERYTIVQNSKIGEGLQSASFIDANNVLSKLVLDTYRTIEENVLGVSPKVYRQLPVGGNAGLILNDMRWPYPEEYLCLKDIPFIQSVLLDPPFIIYPKKNKREGIFNECFTNPLKDSFINVDHWFCYPAKIGNLLAYVYFNRDFMAHGVSLCNLFELASEDECRGQKPDIVYVFGVRDKSKKVNTVFYDDKKNNIMLGYVNHNNSTDYFGYMKKMILTLYNLIIIRQGHLPIHGAMINIVTKDNKTSNIVIVGDSGAGKSETLEAFRQLGENYITDMTIVFDDMGVIKIDKGAKPLGYGTEIGAFVRLDDLDTGYAFRQIDRSIFMNPDKVNARLVIPVATYREIMMGYAIDMVLYANNYEQGEELEFFKDENIAIDVFREGARIAKGTTNEDGLVKTYFANPFGPMQRIEETDKLLIIYFKQFFSSGVRVGQLKTCLGIKGKEKEGPKKAALRLLQQIRNM